MAMSGDELCIISTQFPIEMTRVAFLDTAIVSEVTLRRRLSREPHSAPRYRHR